MRRAFSSLAIQSVLGLSIGLLLVGLGGLGILYRAIGDMERDGQRSTGEAALELLINVVEEDQSLLAAPSSSSAPGPLQRMVENFIMDFDELDRITIVDSRLRVVADTDMEVLGGLTDQNALIQEMQQPREHASSLTYSRGGQRYLRLSHVVLGPPGSNGNRDIIGAASIDLPLARVEAQLRATFLRAAGIVLLAGLALLAFQLAWLRQSVLLPIRGLAHAAGEMGQGRLGVRAPIHRSRDLAEVAVTFNEMADSVEKANRELSESNERAQALIHSSPLAIVELDPDGTVRMWNPAAERLFGWSAAEAVGVPLRTIPPAKEGEAAEWRARLANGGVVANESTQRLRRDGSLVDVSVSGATLHDPAGRVAGFSFIIADVTRIKQAEAAMMESNASLAVSIANLEHRTRDMLRLHEMADLLQACTTPEEAHLVIARSVGSMFPETVGILFELPASRDRLESRASWGPVESEALRFPADACWSLRRGRTHRVDDPSTGLICPHSLLVAGEPNPFPSLCVPMMAHGEGVGVLHVRATAASPVLDPEREHFAETVAEQAALALSNLRLRDALQQQSIRDPLTGLFNRRYLDETLEREIDRARRAGIAVSVIMLDLDHFKRLNDEFGHRAGDSALRAVATCVQQHVRGEDIASRFGGEEFTLVMPGAPAAVAQQRAEWLREAVAALRPSHEGTPLGRMTVSLGVAAFPDHAETGPGLIHAADTALYRAKERGRDRVELAV